MATSDSDPRVLKEIRTREKSDPVCAIIYPLMHCDVQAHLYVLKLS